jgi:signal peptidase II
MAGLAAPQRLGMALIVAVLAADQISKAWLYDYLVAGDHRVIEILPFLNLVRVWNYGVSFGLFNSGAPAASWIFVAVALAIVAMLAVWLRGAVRALPAAALGLVIGGAIGNVVDRIRLGAVFDFIDVHALGWHWPAFNVADSAITVGVILLFADSLFGGAEQSKKGSS